MLSPYTRDSNYTCSELLLLGPASYASEAAVALFIAFTIFECIAGEDVDRKRTVGFIALFLL